MGGVPMGGGMLPRFNPAEVKLKKTVVSPAEYCTVDTTTQYPLPLPLQPPPLARKEEDPVKTPELKKKVPLVSKAQCREPVNTRPKYMYHSLPSLPSLPPLPSQCQPGPHPYLLKTPMWRRQRWYLHTHQSRTMSSLFRLWLGTTLHSLFSYHHFYPPPGWRHPRSD